MWDNYFYGMTVWRWLKLVGVFAVLAGFLIVPVWLSEMKSSFRPCGPTWLGFVDSVELRIATGARQDRARRTVYVLGIDDQRVLLSEPIPDVVVGERVNVQNWCLSRGGPGFPWDAYQRYTSLAERSQGGD